MPQPWLELAVCRVGHVEALRSGVKEQSSGSPIGDPCDQLAALERLDDPVYGVGIEPEMPFDRRPVGPPPCTLRCAHRSQDL